MTKTTAKETISDILDEFSEYIDNLNFPNVLEQPRGEEDLISKGVCAGWILASDAQYSVINFLRLELMRTISNEEYNKVINQIENGKYLSNRDVVIQKFYESIYRIRFAIFKGRILANKVKKEEKTAFINSLFSDELYRVSVSELSKKVINLLDEDYKTGFIDKETYEINIDGLKTIKTMLESDMGTDEVIEIGDKYLEKYAPEFLREHKDQEMQERKGDLSLSEDNEADRNIIEEIRKENTIKNRAKRLIREMGGIHRAIPVVEKANEKDEDYVLSLEGKRIHKEDITLALSELIDFGLNNPLEMSENELRKEAESIKTGVMKVEKENPKEGRGYDGLIYVQCHKTKKEYRYSYDDLMFMVDLYHCPKHSKIKPENGLAV